jgi:hypothetical protein
MEPTGCGWQGTKKCLYSIAARRCGSTIVKCIPELAGNGNYNNLIIRENTFFIKFPESL